MLIAGMTEDDRKQKKHLVAEVLRDDIMVRLFYAEIASKILLREAGRIFVRHT